MTARAAFRQADVTRALRGVAAAGVSGATIRLRPGGEIVIQVGSAANEAGDVGEPNEWDEVYEAPPAS